MKKNLFVTEEEYSERESEVRRIVAEARAKARTAADQLLKQAKEKENLKQMTLIEMADVWSHVSSVFEKVSRGINDYEQSGVWKWLKAMSHPIKEASAKSSGKIFFGGIFEKGFTLLKSMEGLNGPLGGKPKDREVKESIDLTDFVGIVNEVFERAIGLLKKAAQGRVSFIQEPVSQGADMGRGWMEWKNSPLGMVMTNAQVALEKTEVYNAWFRMAGSLMQGIEEAPGLATFFLPNNGRSPLRDKKGGRQTPFARRGGNPLEEFQNLQEEKLTAISEMDKPSQRLLSKIHGNLFRISAATGEYDRARDSVVKTMYEVAKGTKEEDKDALLAEIMKVKIDTAEIKDMIRRIRDKNSEPTPGEKVAPRSDLNTSLGALEWTEDELQEDVRKGLLER